MNWNFKKQIIDTVRNELIEDMQLLKIIEEEVFFEVEKIDETELLKRIIIFVESYFVEYPEILNETVSNLSEINGTGEQITSIKIVTLEEEFSQKLYDGEIMASLKNFKKMISDFI